MISPAAGLTVIVLKEINAGLSYQETGSTVPPAPSSSSTFTSTGETKTDSNSNYPKNVQIHKKRVIFTGATGSFASSINGVYDPTEEIHNNHTVFEKHDKGGMLLVFSPNKKWIVQPRHEKKNNSNSAWCESVNLDCLDPVDITSWNVYNNKWEVQDSVKVSYMFA